MVFLETALWLSGAEEYKEDSFILHPKLSLGLVPYIGLLYRLAVVYMSEEMIFGLLVQYKLKIIILRLLLIRNMIYGDSYLIDSDFPLTARSGVSIGVVVLLGVLLLLTLTSS